MILLVTVNVRDGNVEQALKVLKKKMQREGLFREMKLRRNYEKPSAKRKREKNESAGARWNGKKAVIDLPQGFFIHNTKTLSPGGEGFFMISERMPRRATIETQRPAGEIKYRKPGHDRRSAMPIPTPKASPSRSKIDRWAPA